jgi:hypothetical protein
MVYSRQQYTDFTNVLFTFKMSHSFTEQTQITFYLCPLEKNGLTLHKFSQNSTRSIATFADPLYHISPKSHNECGQYK